MGNDQEILNELQDIKTELQEIKANLEFGGNPVGAYAKFEEIERELAEIKGNTDNNDPLKRLDRDEEDARRESINDKLTSIDGHLKKIAELAGLIMLVLVIVGIGYLWEIVRKWFGF